jgi:hypothetical protein
LHIFCSLVGEEVSLSCGRELIPTPQHQDGVGDVSQTCFWSKKDVIHVAQSYTDGDLSLFLELYLTHAQLPVLFSEHEGRLLTLY